MPTYSAREGGPLGPYKDHVAVTPNDDTDLPDGPCMAIMCTGAGNAVVILEGGRTVTLALLAGYAAKQEYRIRRVKSTSTTATGIVALYV
jgi:hypothetical protein